MCDREEFSIDFSWCTMYGSCTYFDKKRFLAKYFRGNSSVLNFLISIVCNFIVCSIVATFLRYKKLFINRLSWYMFADIYINIIKKNKCFVFGRFRDFHVWWNFWNGEFESVYAEKYEFVVFKYDFVHFINGS